MTHNEEKGLLLKVLNRLLDCPELNLDDLEDESQGAVEEAWEVINVLDRRSRHDVSVPPGNEGHERNVPETQAYGCRR